MGYQIAIFGIAEEQQVSVIKLCLAVISLFNYLLSKKVSFKVKDEHLFLSCELKFRV